MSLVELHNKKHREKIPMLFITSLCCWTPYFNDWISLNMSLMIVSV